MEASKREFKKVLEDMLKSKSDAISDDLKADGNVFFKRAEWYNALMCYNKVSFTTPANFTHFNS